MTINQAGAQADPTNASPINFTVVFSAATTDFSTGDVTLSGTSGATTATVTGSGTTYNVAVSGMTGNGTVIASIAAGVAHDAAGNPNRASTYTDNQVTYDTVAPTVTINQASTQADPTSTSPISFTVVFSKVTTDFSTGDVTLGGTAGATTATVTGSGTTYNVAVSGMTGDGTVTAIIVAGVAHDAAGNANTASTSTDNQVTYDTVAPTVTINQAGTQADPTNASPINFTVVFSEATTDFSTGDVTLGGTAGATTATVTPTATTYNVAVSGMTGDGTVTAIIAAGVAHDAAGNANTASTSTDNQVDYDTVAPTVTINQAGTQADPTSASPINFTVVFSEATTDFSTGDVTPSGTAGATAATVTEIAPNDGTTYNVAVSDMTANGTVIAGIAAGAAHDAAGNANTAGTSTDNQVTYETAAPTVTIDQAVGQADPTGASPISFAVVFNEPVSDFVTGDVTLSGTAGAATATVTEIAPDDGTTYNVAVSDMTGDGTVIASIAAGVAHDAAGNPNTASASADNQVTYDTVAPTVTINQAGTQTDPTNASPINFTVVFSEATTDFSTGDVTLSGEAGATTATVTGSGTTYNVAVSGMTANGTVMASIAAGVAHDAAGNANTAGTSTDDQVTYDTAAPTVTINQADMQADPTDASPINFTVVFNEPVSDFATGDVTLSGTAVATTATVTEIAPNDGTTYNVAVTGMTAHGSVIASLAASVAHDAAGNPSAASTSTDNSVTYNRPPVANDDSRTTAEDTVLTVAAPGVLGNDTDPDSEPLTAVLDSNPSNGTLTLNSTGSFVYTPTLDYNGPDSFTYHASDGSLDSNVATVALTVTAVNDAPVAVNDSYTAVGDAVLTIDAPGVLGNDTDVDGDTLTTTLNSSPSHGTLTLNGDGSFVYTPTLLYFGPDSFTYRAADGLLTSNVATVTLNVSAVNHAPVAADDGYTATEDTALTVVMPGVLSNDSDVDGDTLNAVLDTSPTYGTLSLNGNGSFSYTPTANYNGADSFTYHATDGSLDSDVATVALTVTAVNDAPAFTSTPMTSAAEGVAYAYAVTTTDADLVYGDGLTITAPVKPVWLTLTDQGDGTASLDGTPSSADVGLYPVTLQVRDAAGATASQSFTITVTTANRPPQANAGPDRMVYVNSTATLDGSASSDPDNNLLLGFLWTQTGGTDVPPFNRALSVTTFIVPRAPQVLTFTLTVTDSLGLAGTPDTVVMTVRHGIYLPLTLLNAR